MSEGKMFDLSEAEVRELKNQAAEKLGRYKKQDDVIGTQIFAILGLSARVIYYPFGSNEVWGFTRLNGQRELAGSERPFVAINSSIPTDCQVFAAAHELYHIWFDPRAEAIPANVIDYACTDRGEWKANRFAAEFLVDQDLLWKEMNLYSIDRDNIEIKDILKLAELFGVPYRTMVKRLYEVGAYGARKRNEFLAPKAETVAQYRKRYSIAEPVADGRVVIDNLTDLAAAAYERHLITFEKLEYLLDLCSLRPEDIGFEEPPRPVPPSDDELDRILGGE